jgi:hypothetical protein
MPLPVQENRAINKQKTKQIMATFSSDAGHCMNGNAIPAFTFSLSLCYSGPVSTSAAAVPALEPHSGLRNWDIPVLSYSLRIPERFDHIPYIHILYQTSSLTSMALFSVKYSISEYFFLYHLQQERGIRKYKTLFSTSR